MQQQQVQQQVQQQQQRGLKALALGSCRVSSDSAMVIATVYPQLEELELSHTLLDDTGQCSWAQCGAHAITNVCRMYAGHHTPHALQARTPRPQHRCQTHTRARARMHPLTLTAHVRPGLQHISTSLPQLHKLHVGCCPALTAAAASTALAALPKLSVLNISGLAPSTELLHALGRLPVLRSLHLLSLIHI